MASTSCDALTRYLEAFPGAAADPVGPSRGGPPLAHMHKVMAKTFAILSARGDAFVIVKCDPHLADMLREQYEGVGHRSHLDRRFWISIDLDADVPAKEIKRLIAASYDLVCAKLTKKQKTELAARTT
jgi:predicted DNA-binding protein (MmcQ/YjbR family)